MTIPQNFKFSASNLQDYLDCQRKFELKYLRNVEWPAIESEPILEREHFIEEGKSFHHAVHQHLIGIPFDRISPFIKGANLTTWWQNFIFHTPHLWFEGKMVPELKVTVPAGDIVFTGQFDLLIQTSENQCVIFDWKTTISKPNLHSLRKRIQSRLYPYLLSIIGQGPGGKHTCKPESIRLIYWFPERPDDTVTMTYSDVQFEEDKSYFMRLVNEISNCPPGSFIQTFEEKRCLYCQYRSLCNRGISGGDWTKAEQYIDADLESAIEIDLESIGEIEY